MLQFRNGTPFVGAIGLMPDAAGVDTLVAVIKGTFTLEPHPRVAEEQVPVVTEPAYHGDPASTSLRAAPDISLPKPFTDVLIVGCAAAPRGRPVNEILVEAHVGPISRFARVHGDRFWRGSGTGYAATPAEPFAVMPLTWERAYGGREETPHGWHEFPRNPVGTGFRASDGVYAFDGLPLPNVEHPGQPITSWRDRPDPVGFGAVAPHWEPRRSLAGTYDEIWQATRAPYLPTDFDPRFLQLAPPESISPTTLVGGEHVVLRGFAPSGEIACTLPRPELTVSVVLGRTPHAQPVTLDTITFEPELGRFTLVWRAAFPCDKRALRITEVRANVAAVA